MARTVAVKALPPPRYRVVERGRRLEVIDTRQSGARAPSGDPARPLRTPLVTLPQRTAFDGSARLTTITLYDEKAPRTIALDPASAAIVRWAGVAACALMVGFAIGIVFAPWLLAALPLLADKRPRGALRGRITRWLDKVEREAG